MGPRVKNSQKSVVIYRRFDYLLTVSFSTSDILAHTYFLILESLSCQPRKKNNFQVAIHVSLRMPYDSPQGVSLLAVDWEHTCRNLNFIPAKTDYSANLNSASTQILQLVCRFEYFETISYSNLINIL